ncbi:MAG TPA: sigma-70 family RNA polymerase sigma factor [bacterium]|nr:sigma-70 family RNA polymerase sigma factor [bacterium]
MARLKTTTTILKGGNSAKDQVPRLSREKEIDLIKLAQSGDSVALNQLIITHLSFVKSVARKYFNHCHPSVPINILINEGAMGLVKAVKKFDYQRGCRLITYAHRWIKQSIQIELVQHGRALTVPGPAVSLGQRFTIISKQLEQTFGRQISFAEIPQLTDFSPEDVAEALAYLEVDSYLFDPVSGDGRIVLDTLADPSNPPDQPLLDTSLQQDINKALSILKPKEAALVRLYYGLDGEPPLKLAEIARRWDISREYARVLKESALKKLRRKAKNLKQYL